MSNYAWLSGPLTDALLIVAFVVAIWWLILRHIVNAFIDLSRSAFWRDVLKPTLKDAYSAYQVLSTIHMLEKLTGTGKKRRR